MKPRSPSDTNTGTDSGQMILKKIPMLFMPSILAASTSSSGMPCTYCFMKNTLVADPNRPGIMMGSGVLVQPIVSYMRYVDTSVTQPGIIIVNMRKANKLFLPGKSSFAYAKPASDEATRPMTSGGRFIHSVFQRLLISVPPPRPPTLDRVEKIILYPSKWNTLPSGHHEKRGCNMSGRLLNDEISTV